MQCVRVGTYARGFGGSANTTVKEHHLRTALRLWPGYAAAWTNLGVVLARTGRLTEAVEVWKEGLEKGTQVVGGSTGSTLRNIANALKNLGRYRESLEYYNQALRVQPNDQRVLSNIEFVKSKIGV